MVVEGKAWKAHQAHQIERVKLLKGCRGEHLFRVYALGSKSYPGGKIHRLMLYDLCFIVSNLVVGFWPFFYLNSRVGAARYITLSLCFCSKSWEEYFKFSQNLKVFLFLHGISSLRFLSFTVSDVPGIESCDILWPGNSCYPKNYYYYYYYYNYS